MIRQIGVPSFIVGPVEDAQFPFEDSVKNPVVSCTLDGKLVGAYGTVDGSILLCSKLVQSVFEQFLLLMESAVEFQLLLSVLAKFAGKEIALSDD